MAKTIIIRDSKIEELVLGDKHIHTYSREKDEHQSRPERKVEDVVYEEVTERFCYITSKCVEDKMVDQVEKTLLAACYGTAEELWKCIHKYEKIGYLATVNEDASKIFKAVCAYFVELRYSERQFRKMRY